MPSHSKLNGSTTQASTLVGIPAQQRHLSPMRDLTDEQLTAVLDAHEQWVQSKEQTGQPADLRDTDLKDRDLSGRNLRGARLQRSLLRGTLLHHANLEDVDLTDAQGLLAEQLAGTNLRRAKLPEDVLPPELLQSSEERIKNAAKSFVALLLSCTYAYLAIESTVDAKLISNTASSALPVVGTLVPIADFYYLAPLVLLGAYFYFHLSLLRVWEELAALPAIFPDGRTVDRKTYPWLLSGLVRRYAPQLAVVPLSLGKLQQWLCFLLGWGLVPLLLAYTWWRYLHRHDLLGTEWQGLLLAVAIAMCCSFYCLTIQTLRYGPLLAATPSGVVPRSTAASIPFLVSLGLLWWFSSGLVDNIPPSFSPRPPIIGVRNQIMTAIWLLRCSIYANLENADVSTKPATWTDGSGTELSQVRGAPLWHADLQGAFAGGAFLARANLIQANLRAARLRGADLRQADLRDADLRQAQLQGADLRQAKLARAVLGGANFDNANLEACDVRACNLSRVMHLTQSQVDVTQGDVTTVLPAGLGRPSAWFSPAVHREGRPSASASPPAGVARP